MSDKKETSPIKFPCNHLIKVVGANNPKFVTTVLNIIKRHYPDVAEDKITQRESGNNNYLSLSITVYATSKSELDALYSELSNCPEVMFAL